MTDQNLHLTLEYKKPGLFLKVILWILGLFFLTTVSLFIYFNVKVRQFAKTFSTTSLISETEILDIASTSIKQFQNDYEKIAELPQKYNFLILGTDKVSGRDDEVELTDTMMLLQLNLKDGQVETLSLPRDLYLDDYQTRINALYFYGKEKYPNQPEQLPQEILEQLCQIKINHTLVIGIEDLEKLIGIVGDIEINVPEAFIDPLFPVPGVDVSRVNDPKILYQEVSFAKGLQKMNSVTALQYMRSRHSQGTQGTDDARALRQQLVLQALVQKMKNVRDPQTLGQLYRFYLDRFANTLPLEELVRIGVVLLDKISQNQQYQFSFEKHQLSVYPADSQGVIYNPPLWQTKQQWVYKIKDHARFQAVIKQFFNLEN